MATVDEHITKLNVYLGVIASGIAIYLFYKSQKNSAAASAPVPAATGPSGRMPIVIPSSACHAQAVSGQILPVSVPPIPSCTGRAIVPSGTPQPSTPATIACQHAKGVCNLPTASYSPGPGPQSGLGAAVTKIIPPSGNMPYKTYVIILTGKTSPGYVSANSYALPDSGGKAWLWVATDGSQAWIGDGTTNPISYTMTANDKTTLGFMGITFA